MSGPADIKPPRPALGGLTVAEFLQLPIVRSGLPELVAGERGLDREVRWVHTLDVPDVSDLLRGGEMVLSTGVSVGPEPAAQRRFVADLASEGAVGAAIELGYAWDEELPPAMVEEADRAGLPLIALHRKLRFVEVTETVNGTLLESAHDLMRQGEEVHRRMDALVLRGEGADAIVEELAEMVRNPVLLEDASGELIAYAWPEAEEATVLDAFYSLRWPPAPGRGVAVTEGAMAAPVAVRDRPWGRLIALQMGPALDRYTALALERGAVAIGIGLVRSGYEGELRLHSRSELLFDVVEGRLGAQAAARRAAALGFPRRPGALVPVASHMRPPGGGEDGAEWLERGWPELMPALRAALAEPDRPAIIGARGGTFLAVLDRGRDLAAASAPNGLALIAERFRGALAKHGVEPSRAALAIGRPTQGWAGLPDSLHRAERAALSAALEGERGPWVDASRTEVGQLLLALGDAPELAAFVEERLGPLEAVPGERGRDLMRTLEAYLERGGSKAEAARELHLERQSLYLRLGRIEEVLDVDLSDPGTALALHLAVRARRLRRRPAP